MTDAPVNALSSASEPAPAIWKPALKEAAWAFLAAAVLLIIIYTLAFQHIHPEFVRFMQQDAKPLTATGKDFIPVSVGKGRKAGTQYIIEDFNGDEAILALPRGFKAEDYPFIKVNLSGFTRYSKAKILWQQAGDPTTHALEFNRSGDEVTQIAMVYGGESYAGAIDSIALLFYDGPALRFENNDDVDIVIKSIEFKPFSAARVAEQIFQDWTNPTLWNGASHNLVRGAHNRAMAYPNVVANLLAILGSAILLLWRALHTGSPSSAPTLQAVVAVCLLCFLANDALRWTWRLEQLKDAQHRYDGKTLVEKAKSNDLRCSRFPDDCMADLNPYF